MHRYLEIGTLLGCLFAIQACGAAPQAPRVRFARASEAQLQAVMDEEVVWYEFQRGDRVPMNFLVMGVAEGAHAAIPVVAKRHFFIVLQKGAPPAFSFDGESIAYHDGGQAFLALGRREGTNEITVVTYLGKREEMPSELKNMK